MRSEYEARIPRKAKTVRKSVLNDLPDDVCWPWRGHITPQGYGGAYEPETLRKIGAHRLVWILLIGPLDADEVLDHMCHNPDECQAGDSCPHRACVNPAHLRVTTSVDNTMRGGSPLARNAQKTKCKNGHPFDERNTYYRRSGGRSCRACMIERFRAMTLAKGGKPRPARRRVTDEELRRV